MRKLAYTVTEAATVASVDMAVIVRAIQDGELRARKIDTDMRVLDADIASWLDRCPEWRSTPPV
ncbi:hypothetical protein ACF1AJ_20685 [Leifsonia sp. NPDC014704]|uniref:hypothetical protein n=1 Tax=Leifsonia sp. NPDC014704 TaxID=3364123 RepID=UPI0036F4754E